MQDEKPTRDIPRHEARRNARGVAWRTINQYVFALACGVREFYYGDWIKKPGVAINEAVELVKKYGDEKDYQFVNGLLGTVARKQGSVPDETC